MYIDILVCIDKYVIISKIYKLMLKNKVIIIFKIEEVYFTMLYSQKIKKAMKLAYDKHHGQVDKDGYPYFAHVLHIAECMNEEDEVIVALLHDVLEDTKTSEKDLEKLGFDKNVIEAVKLLTHERYIPYMEYIENLKNNDIAKKVKIQDLKHNLDTSRISFITESDIKRVDKYKKALQLLESM